MLIVSELNAKQIKEIVMRHLGEYSPDSAEHVPLISMMNSLSVLGFPMLIEVVSDILADAECQAFISDPLCSALERVCSTAVGQKVELAQQFGKLEEEHLFKQFEILLSDLETLLPFKSLSRFEALQEGIWLLAGRWLIDKVKKENNMRLRRILINISDELGHWVEHDTDRFENEWTQLMADHLRVACFAGGELNVVLPGSSNIAGIKQLRESRLLSDLRGLKKLSIDGREDVLAWISAYGGYADGPAKGLNELESIDIKAISDEQLRRVDLLQRSETPEQRRLFDLIKQGVSQRAIRDPKPDDLNLEPDSAAYLIAQHCRANVTKMIAGERFTFNYIPAGTFWMGSDDGGPYGEEEEQPRHQVRISKSFWLGQTPVTQEQWQAVMGDNPSEFAGKGRNLPVEEVSWFDCVRYCNKLSELEGYDPVYRIGAGDEPTIEIDLGRNGYRLPTEAEWEYAAKAGTELEYAGSDDIDDVAWYDGNAGEQTMSVTEKMPNNWGLHDMSGNVYEWCSDIWNDSAYQDRSTITTDPHEWIGSASARVRRGGWYLDADVCRVAFRHWNGADDRWNGLGFRLLRCEP